MDHSKLIDEIVSRVAAKLAESEGGVSRADADAAKPGLLILTQQHSEVCHAGLENEALRARFRADCALLCNYEVKMADYEAVVLYQLTNDALGKLASANNSKVVLMPLEASQVIGAVGGIGEIVKATFNAREGQ